MNTYIMLGKFTEKALNSMQEHPDRIKRFREIVESEGAKMISHFLLLGKYDVAAIIEAPNPDVIAKLALIVGKRGFVRTITMPAYTEKEQMTIISKLQ